MGEVLYEERVCPAGYWACVTRGEKLYEQSISMGFMKLMRFICKENSAGQTPPTQHLSVLPLPLALPTSFDLSQLAHLETQDRVTLTLDTEERIKLCLSESVGPCGQY